jgi:hypothetical protein
MIPDVVLNVPVLVKTLVWFPPALVPGWAKFTRLKALKASARNSRWNLSVIAVVLNIDRSASATYGPLKEFCWTFPNVPYGGRINALGLNHWLILPVITGPVKAGFQDGGPLRFLRFQSD